MFLISEVARRGVAFCRAVFSQQAGVEAEVFLGRALAGHAATTKSNAYPVRQLFVMLVFSQERCRCGVAATSLRVCKILVCTAHVEFGVHFYAQAASQS
jgi:hypothetical protein